MLLKNYTLVLLMFCLTVGYAQEETTELLSFNDTETLIINPDSSATMFLMDRGMKLVSDHKDYVIYFHGGYVDLNNIQDLEKRYWGEDIVKEFKPFLPEDTITFKTANGNLQNDSESKFRVLRATKDLFMFNVEGTVVAKDNKRYSVDAQEVSIKINKVIDKRTREKKIDMMKAAKNPNSLAEY